MGNTTLERLWRALERMAEARDELAAMTGVPDAQRIGREVGVLVEQGKDLYTSVGG